MPPRGVSSGKRKRQYEHIKESEKKAGRSNARAEEIAARTVNKQRRQAGETKTARPGARKSSGGRKKTTGSRKTASRKGSARKTSSRKTSSRKGARKSR